ncbi:MAG TPA: hypothetical protein EYQ31_09090 [Candidatus Handelsmanbacteria bacterium]|nr:hypothetical protein [Candidatus Handelsmanbacteria bacterium]
MGLVTAAVLSLLFLWLTRLGFTRAHSLLTIGIMVPAFFDSVWFAGDDDQGRRQQAWFAHVGGGLNLRTAAGLPLVLTKRMAHNVPLAPADSTITEALRFSQVIGTGGSPLFLSMKSRSLPKLLRQVERWRRAWSIEVEEPPDSQGQGNRRLTYLYSGDRRRAHWRTAGVDDLGIAFCT